MTWRIAPLLAAATLCACGGPQNVLDPASPQNRSVNTLFWWMLGVAGAIWILVSVVAVGAAVARRRTTIEAATLPGSPPDEDERRTSRVVVGAVGATVLILLLFLVYDFTVGRALAAHPDRTLTIEIIGHQWWWEIHYDDPNPSRIVVDANELHLPAGVMTQLKLSSRDVIHSFWVPNIAGKRDLIPGYTSSLFVQPDKPGLFRAQCAEFCGYQHAKMALDVVVHPRDEFFAWLERQRAPAAEPSDTLAQQGKKVFLAGPCSSCHAITGVQAYATVGPNLTHLASRRTIAAGSLANTRGNRAGWIVDPQSIKPGVRMPANQLQPHDLQALLAYLETLK